MLSEKRREEIDNEFANVFGADFVKKVNELPDEFRGISYGKKRNDIS